MCNKRYFYKKAQENIKERQFSSKHLKQILEKIKIKIKKKLEQMLTKIDPVVINSYNIC